MYLTRITRTTLNMATKYNFASAASIDYYKLLGVGKESTCEQIHQAFAQVTKKINPDNDPYTFNKLSEAFVILSDNKARDAYDSLLRSYKITYINEQQPVQPKANSYLADRKAKNAEKLRNKYNIDSFGRYRGGIPQPRGQNRGGSLGEIGTLYHPEDIQNQVSFPDHQEVDEGIAESFKDFHKDEKENRTMKRPWISLEVDYKFFSFNKNFKFAPYLQFYIAFVVAIPLIFREYMIIKKQHGTKQMQEKRQAHARAEREKEEAARKAANQGSEQSQ